MIVMEKEVQEIREREGEWKKLVELFGEYKEKTGGEVEQLRKALKDFKSTNNQLTDHVRKVVKRGSFASFFLTK
jgi:DNA anti-recombination protein RmuC